MLWIGFVIAHTLGSWDYNIPYPSSHQITLQVVCSDHSDYCAEERTLPGQEGQGHSQTLLEVAASMLNNTTANTHLT